MAAARPAVLAHLLALSAEDRYGRFATALSDAGIVTYAERIDFAGDLCFATLESDERVSGFIHLAVHGAISELGASVLPPWRRQGRAWHLFRAALAVASKGGIREVFLATGHPAARRICAGLGYRMLEGAGYPQVRVQLAKLPLGISAPLSPHWKNTGAVPCPASAGTLR